MFKRYFEGKDAVFFDLDGTVVDSLPYWEQSYINIFEEQGFTISALKGLSHGNYVAEIWRNLIKEYDLETDLAVDELVKKTYKNYLDIYRADPLEARPGFWELMVEIKKEKGWKVALISNSDKEVVDPVMEMSDLGSDIFDLVITGEEVKRRKPAPDIYKKALKELDLKPQEVLVFEDSVAGSEAAGKAGLDVIAIWDGQTGESNYPDNVLTFMADFHALPGKLDTDFMEHSKKRIEELKEEFS